MLSRLFASPAPSERRNYQADWGDWGGSDSSPTWAGVAVNQSTSLQLLTVYGCVRLISDSISTLPIDVYRKLPDGTATELDVPLWIREPTVDLGFPEWCSQVLSSLLLHGNAYIAVTRSTGNAIRELVPFDPAKIQVRSDGVRRKVYLVNGVPFGGELVHIKGLMLPGSDVGLSPLEMARQAIGLGLATMEYGAKFFDGEGNMPGVIEIPTKAQPEQMSAMAEHWRKKRSRRGKGLPGVLESGATWKPTGVTNEQAQFLATRRYTAAEIAGQLFLLDPSDLGIPVEGTSLTYANLEQRNARRVQVTLLPWIVRIEKAISGLLFNGEQMKFNVEGLLRGDTLTRFQAYQLGAQIGVLTIDEMRSLENLEPLSPQDRKQSRAWQEVGLPALVQDGLMTPNEARAQLGLPPIAGGDVPRDPVAEATPGGSFNVPAS